MGCDIHMHVEKRGADGKWRQVLPSFVCGFCEGSGKNSDGACYFCKGSGKDSKLWQRNYDLFAILADVRNGTWGEGFKPIAQPRGLPKDRSKEVAADAKEWGSDGHSHSWLTLAEVLSYDWEQPYKHQACVDIVEFRRMRKSGEKKPKEYCAATSSKLFSLAEAEGFVESGDAPARGHVVYSWETSYRDAVGEFFFKTYLPAVRELGEPEDMRLVFWFDN